MRRAIITVVLLFCTFQIFVRDYFISIHESVSGAPPDLFYTPDAKYIRPFVLGYDNLAADILFIKTISYFADEFVAGKEFRHLEDLLYVIADLDPMFEKVYLWGGSILMYNGNWITRERIEASTRFLVHGWNYIKNQKIKYRHDPEYWRIPHMIGFNYSIELKDRKKGIPYIEEVAKINGAPSFYRTWVSTLYKKEGDRDEAVKNLEKELVIENLRTALGQNLDKELEKQIRLRLRNFYRELYSEEYADKKLQQLILSAARIKEIYDNSFRFMPMQLYMVMETYKFTDIEKSKLIDLLHFPD